MGVGRGPLEAVVSAVRFVETPIPGAWLLELDPYVDERGAFSRLFCREAYAARGLTTHVEQTSLSYNARRGTLRGMHYQRAPFEEAKLVRCERGAIYDVVLDLRPDSPTRGRHLAVTLRGGEPRALWVPEGCAHGFLSLEDDTWVGYQISAPYAPEYAGGVRYDDPRFGIRWPVEVAVISSKDAGYPDFTGW